MRLSSRVISFVRGEHESDVRGRGGELVDGCR